MDSVNKISEKIIKETFALMLLAGAFFCVFPQRRALIAGIVYGTAISILNFLLLKNCVGKFTRVHNPKRFLVRERLKRQAIYAIAFIAAVRKTNLNNAAVVLGFLLPKIVIYLDNWFDNGLTTIKGTRS